MEGQQGTTGSHEREMEIAKHTIPPIKTQFDQTEKIYFATVASRLIFFFFTVGRSHASCSMPPISSLNAKLS